MSKFCSFSNFQYKFNEYIHMPDQNISIDCGNGYLGEIKEFGFLYKNDKEWGGDTEGEAVCQNIEDPYFTYKKPEEEPIICI